VFNEIQVQSLLEPAEEEEENSGDESIGEERWAMTIRKGV